MQQTKCHIVNFNIYWVGVTIVNFVFTHPVNSNLIKIRSFDPLLIDHY